MTLSKKQFEDQARPLAQKLIDYTMQAGRQYGITDAKIVIGTAEELENNLEKGAVIETVSGTSWNVGVAIYAGDRVMSFSQNTLDFDTLKEAIDQNMQLIHLVPENKDKRLADSNDVYKGPVTDLDSFDDNPPAQEELIDYARKVEDAALSVPGTKTTRKSGIGQKSAHNLVLATNGMDKASSQTLYQAGIAVIAANQAGMQIDGEHSVARHFSDMEDPETVGRTAGENAVAKLGASLPDSTEATIILSPDAARTFYSSVLSAIDGTSVYRESTFLKDKLGKQVMNKGITIEDNPLISRGLGSQATDSAGMKSEKLTFIKDGVLQQFNVSLTEARKLGIAPIGRNDGPTNLSVLPGTQSPEELMADVKDGFYIRGFNGGVADTNSGRFSRPAYGNVIKNGKITEEAVSGFVVSGNLKDMFMKAVVANDTPPLPNPKTSMAVPTTRLDGIKIAGR